MSSGNTVELRDALQMPLWGDDPSGEDPDFLSRQLITYIGNKRSLLGSIGIAVERVKERLGKKKLRVFDAFAGSGVVSRYLKGHALSIVSNDFEDYAYAIGRCYLRNRSEVDLAGIEEVVHELNESVDTVDFCQGFIQELYSPKDETAITPQDRVFYTRENARRLDNYRRLLDDIHPEHKRMLLGSLLSEASIHANTAGVFKGFYKDRSTGIGRFGGSNGDALFRIKGRIALEAPILSRFECDVEVLQDDATAAAKKSSNLDLAYIDPPYNQNPYGSNYFMLNLLVNYERPQSVSDVSGIPTDWRRSGYNVRSRCALLLRGLLQEIDARFLLISYNDEGFISPPEMRALLDDLGSVEVFETRYNAFRGSRSFKNRDIHVTEQLFLVDRRAAPRGSNGAKAPA